MAMTANNDTQATEAGYMVFAGDRLDKNSRIYIAWAPRDGGGLTRLLTRLHKQSDRIGILEICGSSLVDTRDIRRALSGSWAGYGEWFLRTADVEGYMAAIRQQHFDAYVDDGEPEAVAAPAPKRRTLGVKRSRHNMRA